MATSERSGKIQTVVGLIEPEALGITLTHEHMLIDLSYFNHIPDEASERAWLDAPVTMENRNGIIKRTHFNKPDYQMVDEREAFKEVAAFRNAGGTSMVDATSNGIGRDPLGQWSQYRDGVELLRASVVAYGHGDPCGRFNHQGNRERHYCRRR